MQSDTVSEQFSFKHFMMGGIVIPLLIVHSLGNEVQDWMKEETSTAIDTEVHPENFFSIKFLPAIIIICEKRNADNNLGIEKLY